MVPSCSTTILLAWRTVDSRRCAMTNVVRSFMRLARAYWTTCSGTVEGGGGLVQDENRSIAQQRTGNGDALLFAAREPHAPFTNDGVIPWDKLHHEIVPRQPGSGLDLHIAGAEIHMNVLPQGIVEHHILRHNANMRPQRRQGDATDIHSIDGDATAGRRIKTGHQMDQRRFPGTTRSHESHHFAGFNSQSDIA